MVEIPAISNHLTIQKIQHHQVLVYKQPDSKVNYFTVLRIEHSTQKEVQLTGRVYNIGCFDIIFSLKNRNRFMYNSTYRLKIRILKMTTASFGRNKLHRARAGI